MRSCFPYLAPISLRVLISCGDSLPSRISAGVSKLVCNMEKVLRSRSTVIVLLRALKTDDAATGEDVRDERMDVGP